MARCTLLQLLLTVLLRSIPLQGGGGERGLLKHLSGCRARISLHRGHLLLLLFLFSDGEVGASFDHSQITNLLRLVPRWQIDKGHGVNRINVVDIAALLIIVAPLVELVFIRRG